MSETKHTMFINKKLITVTPNIDYTLVYIYKNRKSIKLKDIKMEPNAT